MRAVHASGKPYKTKPELVAVAKASWNKIPIATLINLVKFIKGPASI